MNADAELPLSLEYKVDDICSRFEAAWKTGSQPHVEDHVADLSDAEKPEVLRELILLDVFYRRQRGETCLPTDYQSRFQGIEPAWLAQALNPGATTPASATVDDPRLAEGPGSRIGPYKLLQQIGEGGMGVVFMAEQTHPVRRPVALKIIKPGLDTRQVFARFEAERQALALMDHPNIAKVFEAGTTSAEPGSVSPGRPYFVMELVRGTPITKHCDDHHLTPRQRLELFIPVCQAVQHAHQKGIIHRDLKPSNVLVALYDSKHVPKVIDFGVAKAVGGRLTDKTLYTDFGAVVGTLEYMSPEQAEPNQIDIDTRSDLYSLGVLLYELLTGTTPFERKRLRAAAMLECLRIIREEEPQKPSTRLSTADQMPSVAANRGLEPKKLTGVVRGDLDWIVMKCLDKDRDRRYETANGLALDLQRYLADEPVLASPPGVAYRLRKFARRHPAAAAFTMVSTVAALALGGLFVAQFYNTRLAAANAQLQVTSDQLAIANVELSDSSAKLKKALEEAQFQRTQTRRYLYVSQFTLAEKAQQEGRIGRVMQLLRSVIPENPDQEDLRGFEWYHMWRLHHGEQSRLRGHTEAVTALAFSPDDRLLASGSADQTVKLWDAVTGKEVRSMRGHEKSVTCLAFSPDGKRLASGGADSTVKIWNTATGKELYSRKVHDASVTALAYSPDGRHVLSGSAKNVLRDWEPDEDRISSLHQGHDEPITGVAFSPDGKTIASVSGSSDQKVRPGKAVLWNTATDKEVWHLGGRGAFTSVAFSPDGMHLATGELLPGARGAPMPALNLYDLALPNWPSSLGGHNCAITSLAFSSNGKQLVSASLDQTVRIWDVAARKETSVLHEEAGVLAVAFSPDGKRVAAGSEDRTVKLWAPPNSSVVSLPIGGEQNNAVFSPDGRQLAASSPGKVTVWDLRTQSELKRIAVGPATRVAWSPDGLSLSAEVGLGGWELHGAAFSPDGKLFATASDRRICVWDRSTRACLKAFPTEGAASCVAFSPDGKWLAGGSGQQSRLGAGLRTGKSQLSVWELETLLPVSTFDSKSISVWSVSFSPNGKRLAAATGYYSSKEPGEVRVWDTTDGRELFLLKGHTDCVWSVSFSPDGGRLVSASGAYGSKGRGTGEVKIWDMITGQELGTLRGHDSTVYSAAFSPCGRRLATASTDGTVKIWDGTPLAETPSLDAGPGDDVD